MVNVGREEKRGDDGWEEVVVEERRYEWSVTKELKMNIRVSLCLSLMLE